MSDQYDNTNTGAAFQPWPEQKFILQGKMDVNGNEQNVAIITAESKSGERRLEVYQRVGVLFENDMKSQQKAGAPDYSGPLEFYNMRIAGWRKEKDGKNFMSFQISEKQDAAPKTVDSQPQEPVKFDSVPF